MTSEMTKITRNSTNKIFAIPAAPEAMPPNPNRAAISATTRKIKAHLNTAISFSEPSSPAESQSKGQRHTMEGVSMLSSPLAV